MIDMLFVEVGAVVTEILGPTKCTIEPFCHVARPPAYAFGDRIEVDFARLLANVLQERSSPTPVQTAALEALYDQLDDHGSELIGPVWPGGGYEGVLGVRDDVVKANPTLAAAVATLPGKPWEYQIVTSIDEQTGAVRRYHGFHAEVVEEDGDVLVLRVANAGRSEDPSSPRRTVRYDPADTRRFYSGGLIAATVVRSGWIPRSSGAVFIAADASEGFTASLPKLPPGGGE